ncbi:ubiquitin carboxyl-terminal hydrolase 42-like [Pipra filicauda]|uniref:Ubiquitin carboxyl-terminal hydrolase n=2 Tax=Pipra filicauda TaxID=649802 RepID=A0A6J2G9P0_9PASS|nr:ubiquitin carboxyl-terminal hydrolase 42-like isoform X2 [Pipra filicauda]XP_027600560.1 ubiquitin carboxyl-terminal hydrolase 42-like [Pipra filicauda]
MATAGNDSSIAEGMTPPQRILFPPEKICMVWQQRQSAGAGLRNVGNTCYLNAVLQCLTYTPPLANYLLSREHSQACRQQGFCMMCIMEAHVNKVLRSSVSAILPLAVLRGFRFIGEHFQLGREEDAHDFLCCTVNAMQRACLGASNDLDISSQSTTIVHQIFGGFLRSRVTCFSCKAISDSYEAFLDVPLDIKAASSLTAALEDFVTPEHLDGENCFKCSKCEKNVAATKRFTVHCAPKVLTVCLKRFDCFTGGKISKVVEYPEYLDLRPYMSQADGEPLLYSLYAVLVHSGASCHGGHYFCYTKASNGLWYRMDDESVELCSIDTVLRQQAYLLFYARCSDLRIGERPSSSLAPSHAPSFLSQCVASSKQAGSVGPQGLTGRTKGMKYTGRERSRSRSPLWGRDLRSWSVDTADYDDSSERRTGPPSRDRGPRDSTAARPSKRICRWAPAPRAAQEQTLLRQREPSRSVRGTYNLRSRFVQYTDYDRSLRKRKRERTSPPRCDQVLVNTAVPGPSKASSKQALMLRAAREQTPQRQREQRRSTGRGYDCHSQFVQYTDYRPSEKKRRVSMPQRFTSDKHSGHSGNDGVGLWPWLKQNGRLALRLLAKASLFSTRLLRPK